MIKKGSNKKDR